MSSSMNRIIVIGSPGSGKSTLVREIAVRSGIPAFHLDKLYWQPGWVPHPDLNVFRNTVDNIVAGERWILDGGFYDAAGPERFVRADTVIFLDVPTVVCLFRAIKRWLLYRGDTRPDLAPDCPEKFDLEFYQYILSYRTEQIPKGEAMIEQYFKGRMIRLGNNADRVAFLDGLPASPREVPDHDGA